MTAPREADESNSVTQVEFRTEDSSYPLTELSELTDCRIVLEQMMPGKASGYYSYYQITGESPDAILDVLRGYDGLDVRLVNASDEAGLFEMRIDDEDRYFAPLLTEAGALLSQMWTESGESHILVEIPDGTSPGEVIDLVLENHPTVEVVAKRQKVYAVPLFTQELFQEAVHQELTARQLEVLFTAYANGYFESPREKSGREIAADLEISAPTFSEHLRVAEQKVLSLLF